MATPRITPEQMREAVDALARANGNETRAAVAMGWTRGKLQARLRAARTHGVTIADKPAADGDAALRDRIFELESQMRGIKSETLTDEYVRRKIIKLNDDVTQARVPTWAVDLVRGKSLPGVPSLLWSDWHAGEVVDPGQINGVNEYDMPIMERRVRRLVASTINLLRNHVVNPEYPGIVLNLGGDMLSGDIHEELSESNEKPMMMVLLDLVSILTWAIRVLAEEFGRVFVPCVTGNHGRNTKKPRAKGRNFSNFDWLLYQFLARAFEHDERVQFFIPDGPDASYTVCGHRYLLTHGDQFRGGDGMIGAIGPIIRGNKRKLSRNTGIGLEYDTMLIGHFHQYMPLNSVIVNGSLKGYDEYANSNNFGYEPPIQALWLTHPQYGIRMHLPVYLEDLSPRSATSAPWVSWAK